MVHPILQRAQEESQAIYRRAQAEMQMEKDLARAALMAGDTFDKKHFESIEKLLQDHENILAKYRNLTIDNLDCREQPTVSSLFQAFENVLGPVGLLRRCTC
jgi:hypothetical protein